MVVSNPFNELRRSESWAEKRMDKATTVLGQEVVQRLLAFTWHLLGAQANDLARTLGLPVDTVNGLIKRVYREGLPALEDRRRRASTFRPTRPPAGELEPVALSLDAEQIGVEVGPRRLVLPRNDPLLCRTVLVLLNESDWLDAKQVATALGLSAERVRKLRAELRERGAASLADCRRGQPQDYRMSPEIKAEVMRQYVLNLEAGRSVSPACLKRDLESRGKPCPSPQTLALHLKKIGLDYLAAAAEDAGPKKQP